MELVNQVKQIAHSNPTSEAVFSFFGKMQRFRRQTNLNFLKRKLFGQGIKLVDQDYVELFEQMQKAGIGDLKYGRKGGPDKFNWHFNLKHIAQMGLEGKEPPSEGLELPREAKAPRKRITRNRISKTEKGNYIQITIPREMLKYIKTSAA